MHTYQNAQVTSKQNGTQEKTPFSGTFFQTLSCGVINLVASVKKMTLWLVQICFRQSFASIQCFLKLTLATKWITPCERVRKTGPKIVGFLLVYHFIWGQLSILKDVNERRKKWAKLQWCCHTWRLPWCSSLVDCFLGLPRFLAGVPLSLGVALSVAVSLLSTFRCASHYHLCF